MKKLLSNENIEITSAGLSAIDGMEASRWAQEVMQERGIDISQHRARNLSEKDVEEADLILTMSLSQKREIIERFPSVKDKVFLITELAFPGISSAIMEYERLFERIQQEKERLLSLERDRLEALKRRYEELKKELMATEREISLILSRIEDQLYPQLMQLRRLEEKLSMYEIQDPYGKGKEVYEKVAQDLEDILKLVSKRLKEEWFPNR